MTRLVIPAGYQPRLNPSGTALGYGNGTARVRDLTTGVDQDFGPYAVTGWADDRTVGVTAFTPPDQALRLIDVPTGATELKSVTEPAPIYVTSDGAWWAAHAGNFYRNGTPVTSELAGDLSGQVLSEDGAFFSAENPADSYRTVIFNQHGREQFRLDHKAAWAQMFNYFSEPMLYETVGDQAIINRPSGERLIVASTVPCYRGSLVATEDGSLWASTVSFVDGKTVTFLRPWNETKGIRLDCWGGLQTVHYNTLTRCFAVAGYNQDTGELVCYPDVSIDTVRQDISAGAPPHVEPPVEPPTIPPGATVITVKPGQTLIVKGIA